MSRDHLSMAMRSRLAALGVEANHAEVAMRLDAWDAQVVTSRRRHEALAKLLPENEQLELKLGPVETWPRHDSENEE